MPSSPPPAAGVRRCPRGWPPLEDCPCRWARRPRGRDGARTAGAKADGTDVPHVGATRNRHRLHLRRRNARESFRPSLSPPAAHREIVVPGVLGGGATTTI